jgi:hypothetical protein
VKAHAPIGEKAVSHSGRMYTQTLSAIVAISDWYGIVLCEFGKGGVGELVFEDYVTELEEKYDEAVKRADGEKGPVWLMMDNVNMHKTDLVSKALSTTRFRPWYSCTYSCELNPIEYLFGYWEQCTKIPNTVKGQEEIFHILADSLKKVGKQKVQFVYERMSVREICIFLFC